MKRFRFFLSLLLAAAGPVFMFRLMRHGINYQDEPYQMLNALEYTSTPLAPLSAWVGHLWSLAFGYNLLSFRAFAAITAVLAMALPCVMLYRRTGKPDLSLATFGCGCAWLALVPAKSFLYGWDNLSTLAIVAAACLCVSYLSRATIARSILIGLCCGVAVGARIPNIAVVAVAGTIVVYFAPDGRKTCHFLAFAGACALCVAAWVIAIHASVSNYAGCLSSNIITGHNLLYLLHGYEHTIQIAVQFTCYAGAIVILACIVHGWGAMIVAATVLALGSRMPDFPAFYTPGFLSLGLLAAALVYLRKHKSPVIIISSFALCATAGSDLGLEKVITVQFIPVLFAVSTLRQRDVLLRASAVISAICFYASIQIQAETSFEDPGFRHTTVRVDSTPFSGICTTPERAAEIQELERIISSWQAKGGEVLVIGDCFHFAPQLIALTPRPAPIRHVYLIDYTTYVPVVDSLLQKANRLNQLVIATRPFDWRYPESATQRFPSLLCRRAVSTPQFDVFYPTDSENSAGRE